MGNLVVTEWIWLYYLMRAGHRNKSDKKSSSPQRQLLDHPLEDQIGSHAQSEQQNRVKQMPKIADDLQQEFEKVILQDKALQAQPMPAIDGWNQDYAE